MNQLDIKTDYYFEKTRKTSKFMIAYNRYIALGISIIMMLPILKMIIEALEYGIDLEDIGQSFGLAAKYAKRSEYFSNFLTYYAMEGFLYILLLLPYIIALICGFIVFKNRKEINRAGYIATQLQIITLSPYILYIGLVFWVIGVIPAIVSIISFVRYFHLRKEFYYIDIIPDSAPVQSEFSNSQAAPITERKMNSRSIEKPMNSVPTTIDAYNLFCEYCGAKLVERAAFCGACGKATPKMIQTEVSDDGHVHEWTCKYCLHENSEEKAFCSFCKRKRDGL